VKLEQLDHVALTVSDVERSIAWYRDVLGLERRHEEWGTEPAMMCTGDTCVALFEGDGADTALRHVAFRVNRENFERAQGELREHGIEWQFFDHHTAHSIYFRDPDDHELEITTYEVPS